MKQLGTLVFVVIGLAIGTFAADVAFRGAEPPLPAPGECVEGTVLPDATTPSPVGEPFLYGEVRIQDADNTETNVGTIHWRGAFGNPRIRVQTARGERTVRLGPPQRWHVLEGSDEERTVASLEHLPIVAGVEVGERISPPFRLGVRVVRPGDHVIVREDPSARVPVYVGARAALAHARDQREAGRFPIVALLSIMALVSFYVARRIQAGTGFDAPVPEG